MTRKEIDDQILKLANLLQMMVNIDNLIKTTKDPKQLNEYNIEYRLRFQQAKEKSIKLNNDLDEFFKIEAENKRPIDFKLVQAKKTITQFI